MLKEITNCRCCGSNKLVPYSDFGMMPLNSILTANQQEALKAHRYPLILTLCQYCSLSQLKYVLDYKQPYRSEATIGYKESCRSMALDLKERLNLDYSSFHLDIAGNDGTLLREFKNVLNHKILNVDPDKNLEQNNALLGVPMFTVPWSKKVAIDVNQFYGKANLITAINIFAHVDDTRDFLQGCRFLLNKNGMLVIEIPYVVDTIERNEFDAVSFDQLSYFTLPSMVVLCVKNRMRVVDVERYSIHGSSIRYYIQNVEDCYKSSPVNSADEYIYKLYNKEIDGGFSKLWKYQKWDRIITENAEKFSMAIKARKAAGVSVAAFAASTKGNVLLNRCKIDYKTIDYIVDETPEKIGKFSPGTGIPIVGLDKLMETPPSCLIILSWNFKDEIIKKCNALGYSGRYIIPIPDFHVI